MWPQLQKGRSSKPPVSAAEPYPDSAVDLVGSCRDMMYTPILVMQLLLAAHASAAAATAEAAAAGGTAAGTGLTALVVLPASGAPPGPGPGPSMPQRPMGVAQLSANGSVTSLGPAVNGTEPSCSNGFDPKHGGRWYYRDTKEQSLLVVSAGIARC